MTPSAKTITRRRAVNLPPNLGDVLFRNWTWLMAATVLALTALLLYRAVRRCAPGAGPLWPALPGGPGLGSGLRAVRGAARHLRHGGLVAPCAGHCRAAWPAGRYLPGRAGTAERRPPISFLIELLASIPSVIYGLWGLFVLVPFLRQPVRDNSAGQLGLPASLRRHPTRHWPCWPPRPSWPL